ncbi:MAG: DUF1858 domain-containing protein [Candidatus Tectomicrobia bacterium]|nr:DUF1858 domain-containing protein [Candidatus Tectomicrobia bacterium]
MLTITFILSLVGLCVALLAFVRGRAQARRVDELHRSLSPTLMRQQESLTRLERRVQQVGRDLRRRFGELQCRRETTLVEAMEMEPGVRDLLLSCLPDGAIAATLNPSQTIEEFCRVHAVSLETMLPRLNRYLDDPSAFRDAWMRHANLVQIEPPKPAAARPLPPSPGGLQANPQRASEPFTR